MLWAGSNPVWPRYCDSLSHSVVFLYFFALVAEQGFLLSLLAILWNSAFRCLYLSFFPLLLASLLFTAICKASPDSYFAFLHFGSGKLWRGKYAGKLKEDQVFKGFPDSSWCYPSAESSVLRGTGECTGESSQKEMCALLSGRRGKCREFPYICCFSIPFS